MNQELTTVVSVANADRVEHESKPKQKVGEEVTTTDYTEHTDEEERAESV